MDYPISLAEGIMTRDEPARNNADRLPKWDLETDYDIDEILEEEFTKRFTS